MKTIKAITGITGGFATPADDTEASAVSKGQTRFSGVTDTVSVDQLVASLQGIFVASAKDAGLSKPSSPETIEARGSTYTPNQQKTDRFENVDSSSGNVSVNDALPEPSQADQWHLQVLGNLNAIWADYTGAGIHVGVYDEGIQKTHHDLDANYNAALELGGSVTVDPKNASGTTGAGHGTSVAGLIAAENNGVGTIGVAYSSSVTAVNIFDPASSAYVNAGDPAGFFLAMHEQGRFDVVNHSWGSTPSFLPSQNLTTVGSFAAKSAIEYSYATVNGRSGLGTIVVKSAGNDGRNANGEGTNNLWETITVAASRDDGFASSYTNYGSNILVTAPAGDIISYASRGIVTTDLLGTDGYNVRMGSTEAHDYTNNFGGTSAAAPIVSAVVALMLDANENLGWRDVQNILAASARHTGSSIGGTVNSTFETDLWQINGADNWNGGGMHFSNDYGYGMVNAYNAVRMAEAWWLFGDQLTSANIDSSATFQSGAVTHVLNDANTNGGLTEYAFEVTGNIELEHIDLTLTLTHTYFTDLRIELISPDGQTSVMLADRSAGDSTSADNPLTWSFGIDALHGELSAGTWKLRFIDNIVSDAGTLTNVSFTGRGVAPDANDVYTYTDEFDMMVEKADDGANRTILVDSDGGTDWINLAAKTGNVTINLTPGQMSSLGFLLSTNAGSVIENVVTGDGNDKITGNSSDNFLLGVRGNDTIDGGTGNDTMWGGVGNDTYYVNALTDEVYESNSVKAVGGDDTVIYSGAPLYSLGANLERLTLLQGSAATQGTGNALDNTLTGNSVNNTLDGAAGSDTMIGGNGADYYYADVSTDVITETNSIQATGGEDTVYYTGVTGTTFTLGNNVERLVLSNTLATHGTGNGLNNTLTGNIGANTLKGLGGNDSLDGMGGVDRMDGGDGNDTYFADVFDDVVVETNSVKASGGDDTVKFIGAANTTFTLAANIERLTLGGSLAIHGTGNGLANTITGNNAANTIKGLAGDDSLDGMGGIDRMEGGDGNDTFYADVFNDVVVESNTVMATGGNDIVIYSGGAGTTFTLGLNIERLNLSGSNASNGTGNTLANIINGNTASNILKGLDGNDTLDGGASADKMEGGNGNDKYFADVATDQVVETNADKSTGGDDTVLYVGVAASKFTLGANVERLTLLGANATNGAGNNLANTLVGNGASNKLNGMDGKDTLTGGNGKDYFEFSTTLSTNNVDTITLFESNGVDEISLSKAIFGALGKDAGGLGEMKAGFFHAAAGAVAGAALDDRIIYNTNDGTLRFDADGNKAGGVEAILFAQFTTKPAGIGAAGLDATDFLIV